MLWDDEYFYVAAEMEEPDLWGTLTERDSVIFHDNDFEVFIDPDGDTHAYYELEVNALGTPWDLMLLKPYRDGGPAIDAWDIAGLQVGVDVRGTLNRPGDRDDGWTVEIAMPWQILREAAPDRKPPQPGDRWRVNFSRVQWQLDVADGRYAEACSSPGRRTAARGQLGVEPAGRDQHAHARALGICAVLGRAGRAAGTEPFVEDPNERVKWALRRLYYRQRRVRATKRRLRLDAEALAAADIRVDGLEFRPSMHGDAVALRDRGARVRRRRGPHRPGRSRVDGRRAQGSGLKAQGRALSSKPLGRIGKLLPEPEP